MAHTFDIRFVRSGGLAGVFEAPSNSFRWKGAGRLSIDAQGISIAVKRSLPFLFPRSRRFAAGELTEVMREGDALRVEFATGKTSRAVVPFWVRDAKIAREIVRLLPTQRTVEMEHDAAGVARTFRIDWRALMLLGLAAAAMVSAFWITQRGEGPSASIPAEGATLPTTAATQAVPVSSNTPARSIEDVNSQAMPRPAVRPQSRPAPRIVILPSVPEPGSAYPGTEYPGARSPAEPYAAYPLGADGYPASATLTGDVTGGAYTIYVQPVDGVVPIVQGMAVYETARRELVKFRAENGNWWEATVRIHNDPALDHPDLHALRDMELAISMAWRGYQDSPTQFNRELAERLTKRLDLYVR